MNPDLSKPVIHAIEHVCKLGCRHVNEVIRELESGQCPKEIDGLGKNDRRHMLHELKQIMAVYKGGTCGT